MDDNDASAMPVSPAAGDWRTYTLTEADLVESTRSQYMMNLRTRRALLMFGGFAALLLAWGYTSDGRQGLVHWALWIVTFAILFPFFMSRVGIPRQIRSTMKTQPALRDAWRIAVSDDALHLRNAAGDVRYRWDGFVGWRAGPTVLILSTSPAAVVPIPLRALEPGERERIEAHLRAAGVALDGPGATGR